jgi:hypothetical protein
MFDMIRIVNSIFEYSYQIITYLINKFLYFEPFEYQFAFTKAS